MHIPRVQLPDKPFDLAYRLSTPAHRDYAEAIEPSFPTILFVHPLWTDSFFFYPQYDDPLFNENYNLLAFDMPAHGSSVVRSKLEEEYTWTAHAKVLIEALRILHVGSVHVVGVSMGCTTTIPMATLFPGIVESITLVTPPAVNEPEDRALAYADIKNLLDAALDNQDPEALSLIARANMDFNTAQMNDPVIRQVYEEYVELGRRMMAVGHLEAYKALPINTSLISSRTQFPLPDDDKTLLECPFLVLQGTDEGWERRDYDWEQFVERRNGRREEAGNSRNGTRVVLEGMSRWMTLTAPNVLNPLVNQFISRKLDPSSDPFIPAISPPQMLAQRPTRPRCQDIEISAIVSRRPICSVSSGEPHSQENLYDAGVNVEVEVLVKVDEGR